MRSGNARENLGDGGVLPAVVTVSDVVLDRFPTRVHIYPGNSLIAVLLESII